MVGSSSIVPAEFVKKNTKKYKRRKKTGINTLLQSGEGLNKLT